MSDLDIRSSSCINDALRQTGIPADRHDHRTSTDDGYFITARADPTAWFKIYRLEGIWEDKWSGRWIKEGVILRVVVGALRWLF